MQFNPTYREILALAVPIIIGSLAQSLISVADTAFMGRVSPTAQAAIGYVSLLYLILFMIGFSYTKGAQILIAARLGQNKPIAAGSIADNTVLMTLGFALILFLGLSLFKEPVFGRLLTDEAIREQSMEFFNIRIWGLFPGFAGAAIMAFYMGAGRTKVILAAISFMSALNILLNYVLIYGKWGFPALGIRGAAYASNIAEISALLIFLADVFRKRLHIQYGLLRFKTISLAVTRRTMSIAYPIVLQSLIGLTAWFSFFTLIEKMGEQELAVSSIVKNIYMFLGIPTWGFASAANTLVSNIMGQGRHKDVLIAIRKIIILSFAGTGLLCLLLTLFMRETLFLYTDNPEIIEAAIPVLYVAEIALFVFAFSTILFNGLVSTGSSRTALFIEIASIAIYLVFLYFLFYVWESSLAMVWTSEWLYWICIAGFTLLYFKWGAWKQSKL